MPKEKANIWVASSDGDLDRVKEIVEADKTKVNAKDENGYTALHAASSWKRLDVLNYLIENNGDVNITDCDGDTPLHICEDVECAQLLLDHGADPNAKNHEGLTPVHTTLENEATDVTELLCSKLGIPVPTLEDVFDAEQDEARDNDLASLDISKSKLENLSNWIMQQVDDKDNADEGALREMVTKYIMQNLRVASSNNEDDTVAATVATSTDRKSQDNDSTTASVAATTESKSK